MAWLNLNTETRFQRLENFWALCGKYFLIYLRVKREMTITSPTATSAGTGLPSQSPGGLEWKVRNIVHQGRLSSQQTLWCFRCCCPLLQEWNLSTHWLPRPNTDKTEIRGHLRCHWDRFCLVMLVFFYNQSTEAPRLYQLTWTSFILSFPFTFV